MNRVRLQFLLTFVISGFPFLHVSSQEQPEITVEELREHVRYLASDSLEGRATGTRGADLAAEYIAAQFRRAGLEPRGDNRTYLQNFEVLMGYELGSRNSATIRVAKRERTLVLQTDFRPLGFSASGTYSGDVVFAGYGITLPGKAYDDYAGLDVAGKAVMILREHPDSGNPHSEFISLSGIRHKVTRARELGAKAIMIVGGLSDAEGRALLPFTFAQSGGTAGILVFTITREIADQILEASHKNLRTLEEQLVASKKPASLAIEHATVALETEVSAVMGRAANVVGFLPGNEESLRQEVVVLGAHYDHLGYGGEGSGSLKPDTSAIHNGADDNASGTAGLIELAEYFAMKRPSLKRGLVFIAFSREERGLLGSAVYVERPAVALEKTVAMVNMDMIGRLSGGKLIVYGVGTSPGFSDLLTRHAPEGINVKPVPDGFGPSDQSSFYAKQIPVLHFFTDLHSDYHKPSDDWDKLAYTGMKSVLEMVASVALELNGTAERPSYVSVASPRRSGEGRGIRSYTGTIPDFGEQSGGMKLSGVTEGSPAAVAGLQAGDLIVKFGTVEIKNLYDYTFALGEYKPGDVVDVVVKRGNETKTFRLTVGIRK
ncbi:MAG: M28 family peptidase [Ignavibacteriales bacterium]|nr:M28 family peptidase [Ignavibacteriales bacterium]